MCDCANEDRKVCPLLSTENGREVLFLIILGYRLRRRLESVQILPHYGRLGYVQRLKGIVPSLGCGKRENRVVESESLQVRWSL